ncbi:hypothetical protein Tco_1458180 [Tanacetum coccineum]
MDQDSAHMVAASKVPMLKPGEYEIWRMRIEQYIQMIDYALWEVIENGATLPKTKTIRRNKADLDTMSMDDLLQQPHEYVTKSLNGYQLSSSTQIMAFVSFQITTLANTKRSINTTHGVSTASTQVNAANFTNIDNFSDVVICAFFASQPNSLKWSATTATKGDILLESAELQEIKTTRTRKAQEGVCLWKYILPSFGVSCDGLVDMIGVMQVEEGPN